ncbi:MAG TPA: MFS transporter [Stellaceae bacterium]|jgi:SHS family lactate transporter-like MFS transporter
MTSAVESLRPIAWWKEPTKEQWHAWVAAWLGWTLDAFDFTIFLLIMVPIAQSFHVALTEVTAVFTITLWMRLVGATGAGWLSDRIGRKTPLMIAIGWYSVCNLLAGFAPAFWLLFLFRALLGIGMGAEWPVGAALAMESWPQRSRGLMAGALQSSWGLGALLSSAAYGLLYNSIGWRGLLIIGVAPSLLIVYVQFFVKEPAVWLENRRLQRAQKREVRLPLLKIFKRGMLANTMTACWWMASGFVVGYSIGGLFPSYLEKQLHLSPGLVALPIMLQSLLFFLSGTAWGWAADRIGRRWAMILPAIFGILCTPFYLFTQNYTMIVIFFSLQGLFAAGGIYGQNASYLSERFPTEVRATAAGFCYHQGAIFGGIIVPIIAYFAVNWHLGFAIPMAIGTLVALVSFIAALLMGPETKGTQFVAELSVA